MGCQRDFRSFGFGQTIYSSDDLKDIELVNAAFGQGYSTSSYDGR